MKMAVLDSAGIRKRHSESLSVKPRDGSGYIEWEEFRQAAVQTDGRCTGRVGRVTWK